MCLLSQFLFAAVRTVIKLEHDVPEVSCKFLLLYCCELVADSGNGALKCLSNIRRVIILVNSISMTSHTSEINSARDFPLALFTDIEFELAVRREQIMHLTNGLVGS